MKNRKIIILILAITLFWFVGSVYYYTCNIKQFCKNNNVEEKYIKNTKDLGNTEEVKIIESGECKENNSFQELEDDRSIKGKAVKEVETKEIQKENRVTIKCMTFLNSNIKLNSKNNIKSEVEKLEKFLSEYFEDKEGVTFDGSYSRREEDLVKKFQKEHNLKQDGVVGFNTLKTMNAVDCVKKEYKKNN